MPGQKPNWAQDRAYLIFLPSTDSHRRPGARPADAVAQTSSVLCAGFPIGKPRKVLGCHGLGWPAGWKPAIRQVGKLRYVRSNNLELTQMRLQTADAQPPQRSTRCRCRCLPFKWAHSQPVAVPELIRDLPRATQGTPEKRVRTFAVSDRWQGPDTKAAPGVIKSCP
jgi:hypothetical protein